MRSYAVELLKFCMKIFLKKNIILLYNNKNTSQPSGRCSKINFKKQHTSISYIVCAEIRRLVIFKGYSLHLIGVLLIKFNFNFEFRRIFILSAYNSHNICVFRHSNDILIELKKNQNSHISCLVLVFVWERNLTQTCIVCGNEMCKIFNCCRFYLSLLFFKHVKIIMIAVEKTNYV
jgi:hypothetical protein